MRELSWASSSVPVIAAIGGRNKKSGIQDHPQLCRQLNGSQTSRTCLNQMCMCAWGILSQQCRSVIPCPCISRTVRQINHFFLYEVTQSWTCQHSSEGMYWFTSPYLLSLLHTVLSSEANQLGTEMVSRNDRAGRSNRSGFRLLSWGWYAFGISAMI